MVQAGKMNIALLCGSGARILVQLDSDDGRTPLMFPHRLGNVINGSGTEELF
jgi:hypothetical protein